LDETVAKMVETRSTNRILGNGNLEDGERYMRIVLRYNLEQDL